MPTPTPSTTEWVPLWDTKSTAHHATHETGGVDEILNIDASRITSGIISSARLPPTAVVQTTILTGTQHNFALTAGCTTLRCNNATALTITGFSAGYSGQLLIIISIGAGQVNFTNNDAGSSAGNKLLNSVTTFATPLAAGYGRAMYLYDTTSALWRLIYHDQGAPISYTPTWYSVPGAPVVGNGSLIGAYVIKGKLVDVTINLFQGSTSTPGGGSWLFSLPIPISTAAGVVPPVGSGFVSGGGGAANYAMVATLTTWQHAAADILGVYGSSNVGAGAPASGSGDTFRASLFGYPIL